LPSFILPAKPEWKDKLFGLLGAMLKKTDDQLAFICFLRQITIYVIGLKPIMECTYALCVTLLICFTLCGYYKDVKALAQKRLRYNAITCGRKHLKGMDLPLKTSSNQRS